MPHGSSFQSTLRVRILTVLGAASAALPLSHCDRSASDADAEAAFGAGGGSEMGDAGAYDGNGLLPPATMCFNGEGLPCPTNPQTALGVFQQGCTGVDVAKVLSPPTVEGTQCCYLVVPQLCNPSDSGRLYLVDGHARTAEAVATADERWTGQASPRTEGLSSEARAYLAAAWMRDALAEHASVASFARLTLALLSVGAPADLLAETQRAALDEVEHASLCFSLSHGYAGRRAGPGPFPLERALSVPRTLLDVAVATVREGCVGELVAASLASAQLERATDPAVRAALTRIAADEARHAELAWRIVAWALAHGGASVRDAVALALAETAASALDYAEAPPAGVADAVGAHGRLDRSVMRAVVTSTLDDIVTPCARALLAPETTRPTQPCSPPNPHRPAR